VVRVVPGIVVGVEGRATLPDGEDQVPKFAQGVTDGKGRMVGMLGADTLVQRLHGGIVLGGGQGGVVQIARLVERDARVEGVNAALPAEMRGRPVGRGA